MNERTQLKQPGYHPIHPGADRGALPVRGDARRPLVQRRPLAGPVRSLVAAPGPLGVQAKLTVGRPGDLYEQEADRVADQVLRMPEAQVQRACPSCAEEETAQTKRLGPTITPLVQRQAEEPEEEEEETAQRQTKAPEEDEEEEVAQRQTKAPEEDEEEEVAQRQTKAPEEDEEEEETVQAKAAGHAPAVSSAVQAQIGAMRGGGQPLPTATRAFFEPRFGCDFGGVRVHSDARAAATARALSARAFTLGRDVVFGAGEYAPGTEGGRRLLAHELTHVVQQGSPSFCKGDPRTQARIGRSVLSIATSQSAKIQRSVQETGVRSPGHVLQRIALSLIKNAGLPIPLQLYRLGNEFHPGEGVDDPRNAFVYTCKGGWIDMGHFFFAAAGGSLPEPLPSVAERKAVETEIGQQRERTKFEHMRPAEREKYFGRSWKAATPEQLAKRGSAWSAYTIEDLPSDKFGLDFGRSMRPLDNINRKMAAFFSRQGAVDASANKEVLKRMMVETLGTQDPEKLPRQHFSYRPVLLVSARALCGSR